MTLKLGDSGGIYSSDGRPQSSRQYRLEGLPNPLGSFNLAFIPIIYCFFPETANLTLEEVDRMFEKGGVYSSKVGRTVDPGSGLGTERVDVSEVKVVEVKK